MMERIEIDKFLTGVLSKKVQQYEQNRKYLELGLTSDTSDKLWRLDKMRSLLNEIDCIKEMINKASIRGLKEK